MKSMRAFADNLNIIKLVNFCVYLNSQLDIHHQEFDNLRNSLQMACDKYHIYLRDLRSISIHLSPKIIYGIKNIH
jgi:hypothetical protein